jgi:hypothetical protein
MHRTRTQAMGTTLDIDDDVLVAAEFPLSPHPPPPPPD